MNEADDFPKAVQRRRLIGRGRGSSTELFARIIEVVDRRLELCPFPLIPECLQRSIYFGSTPCSCRNCRLRTDHGLLDLQVRTGILGLALVTSFGISSDELIRILCCRSIGWEACVGAKDRYQAIQCRSSNRLRLQCQCMVVKGRREDPLFDSLPQIYPCAE